MKLRWLQKPLMGTMAMMLAFSGLLATAPVAAAAKPTGEANERVNAFINLGAGKQTSSNPTDMGDLTEDELRFLGVFLSNFYQPFVTELGVSATNVNDDATKEAMKKALMNSLAFDETYATIMVETIMTQMRSGSKELKWAYGKTENAAPSTWTLDSGANPASLYNLQNWSAGYAFANAGAIKNYYDGKYINTIFYGERTEFPRDLWSPDANPRDIYTQCVQGGEDLATNVGAEESADKLRSLTGLIRDTTPNKDTADMTWADSCLATTMTPADFANLYNNNKPLLNVAKNYQYAFLYYEGADGTNVPVFNLDLWGKNDTAAMASLHTALTMVDPTKGYGFNFLDLSSADVEDTTRQDTVKTLVEGIGDTGLLLKVTSPGTRLYVSPFGDILSIGGNHQVVALPGAMNPYTWHSVDSTGTDTGSAGDAMMAINFPMIAKMSANTLFTEVNGTAGSAANTPGWGVLLPGTTPPATGSFTNPFLPPPGTSTTSAASRATAIYNTAAINAQRDALASNGKTPANGTGTVATPHVRGSTDTNFTGSSNWFTSTDNEGGRLIQGVFTKLSTEYPKSFRAANYASFEATSNSLQAYYYGNRNNLLAAKSLPVLLNFIQVDNMGVYGFGTDNEADYNAFNAVPYLQNYDLTKPYDKTIQADPNLFTNQMQADKNGYVAVADSYSDVSKQAIFGVYLTYAFAGLYGESQKADTIGALGYRLASDTLPSLSDKTVELPKEALVNVQIDAIRNWVYYLLHPTDGMRYVTTLVSNKTNALVLGWHNDMVGTEGVGILPGTTKYVGFTGYVTTPELSDVEWIDGMVTKYNDYLIYFIIAVSALMALYAVAGVLTMQQAVAGAVLFAICAFIPVPAINAAVSTSNKFSAVLYNQKFTYWSLLQHESYVAAMDKAATSENYSQYLNQLYQANDEIVGASDNAGGNSIVVRWQAPKKMQSLMLTKELESAGLLNSSFIADNVSNLVEKTFSGQTYSSDPNSLYLLRSYADLANWSRYIYASVANGTAISTKNSNLDSGVTNSWNPGLKDSYANRKLEFRDYINSGYTNTPKSSEFDENTSVSVFMGSRVMTDAIASQTGKIKDMEMGDLVGIDQRYFNFDMTNFTQGKPFCDYLAIEASDESTAFTPCPSYAEKDLSSLAVYGLYSESPFYFFSWNMYDSGKLSTSPDSTSGYSNLLLGENNGKFFYNVDNSSSGVSLSNNGSMKDYMDMKSLFTYVIPYMKQGNDVVAEWDNLYGLKIHPGVSTDEGRAGEYSGDPQLTQQYWHNVNVARLYNMYSPWVDLMYDSSYAKPETIDYMGVNFTIDDPLNPQAYPDERPMIFSETQMIDMGMKTSQLTAVEQKILNVEKNSQKEMVNLLNYYNFHDTVTNSAASMAITFAFNQEFSDVNLFGSSNNLYPQGYELNNFTYDAFMRLILANSTGMDITSMDASGGYYEAVTNQSSFTTAILLLANDFVAVYALPLLKLFFIIGIFIMSVLMLLASAIKVEENVLKNVVKSLVKPLFLFLLISCGMAWVISMFMSNGNTAVTGYDGTSIKLNDPGMTLLMVLLINSVVVFLFFKILMGVFKDLKKYGKAVGTSIAGVATGVGSSMVSAMKGMGAKMSGSPSAAGASSGGISGGGDGSGAAPSAMERASGGNPTGGPGVARTVATRAKETTQNLLGARKSRRVSKANQEYTEAVVKSNKESESTRKMNEAAAAGAQKLQKQAERQAKTPPASPSGPPSSYRNNTK